MFRHFVATSMAVVVFCLLPGPADARPRATRSDSLPSSRLNREQTVYLTVLATYNYDSSLGLYVYDYSVTNDYSSDSAVELFGFDSVGPTTAIDSPYGWIALRGFQGHSESIIWSAVGTSGAIPTDLTFLQQPASSAVYPGQTIAGFRLLSPYRPIYAEYYAMPFEPLRSVDTEDEDPSGPFSVEDPGLWDRESFGWIDVPGTEPPVLGADSSLHLRDELMAPSQNPARGRVGIAFSLGRDVSVELDVLDVGGRRVKRIESGRLRAGLYRRIWDGRDQSGKDVPAGVYFMRLRVDGRQCGSHSVVMLR